jgi:hypothetical protein
MTVLFVPVGALVPAGALVSAALVPAVADELALSPVLPESPLHPANNRTAAAPATQAACVIHVLTFIQSPFLFGLAAGALYGTTAQLGSTEAGAMPTGAQGIELTNPGLSLIRL